MPPGGEPALSGRDARLGTYVDRLTGSMAETQRNLFRVLLHMFDDAPVPKRGGTFQSLDLATRTEVLQGWHDSDNYLTRQAIGSVLILMSFGWTLHPDVVGYFRPHYGCGYGE